MSKLHLLKPKFGDIVQIRPTLWFVYMLDRWRKMNDDEIEEFKKENKE
jgi:hypothetical protein